MTTDIKTIIQTAELPPIPTVLQQILSLADNPRTTSNDLEKIVVREPSLVTQILKWVNSASYSLPQRISSVSHAMILLGFSTVKSIASGMILINAFDETPGLKKDFVNSIWKHTLSDANILKVLAASEPTAIRDDLFLAGMIHDVGYLILSSYFTTKYEPILKANPFPEISVEKKKLGVDHAEIGAALLVEWKFPERVIDLVRFHHDATEFKGEPRHLAYLKIADRLSYEADLDTFLSQPVETATPDILSDLKTIGWNWDKLCAQRETIVQSVDMIRQLF